jgi:NAD(P)-dependent dehydrogenase (short-subunit alcohol dehydrogenase family)
MDHQLQKLARLGLEFERFDPRVHRIPFNNNYREKRPAPAVNPLAGRPHAELTRAASDPRRPRNRPHYVAAFHAAPLLIANGRGLIVNTGHYGSVAYYHGPAYGAQKAGSDKMAADMAKELRPHGVAAVSIWMGGLDTERARAYLDILPPESRPTAKRESPGSPAA